MFNPQRLAIAVVASLILIAPAIAGDKIDMLAKETAESFCKALTSKDVDGMMKLCDVPWSRAGKQVIKDRDELKKEFQKAVNRDGVAGFKFEFGKVGTLEKLEEEAGKKLPEEKRKQI